jgi:hypothetical protein
MAQRDATPAQLAKLKTIKKTFPHAKRRTYRVDPLTGIMRVEVLTQHQIVRLLYNQAGKLTHSWHEVPLDAPSPTTADPATHTYGTLREPREPTPESCGKVGHEPNCICHRY